MDQDQPKRQRNYGTYIILKRNSNGEPTIVLGPHWPFAIITLTLSVAMSVWLIIFINSRANLIWVIIVSCSLVFYFYAYLKIILKSPGFAEPLDIPETSIFPRSRYCPFCHTKQSNGVIHCNDCQVCIKDFDHHCVWTGKCIGGKNVKDFYFFIWMTFLHFGICFVGLLIANSSLKNKMAGQHIQY